MKWSAILAVAMVPALVYGGATISLTVDYPAGRDYYNIGEDIELTLHVNPSEPWNGFNIALASDTAGLKIKERTILLPPANCVPLEMPVDPVNDLNAVKANLGLYNIGANPWPAGDNATQTILISTQSIMITKSWIDFNFADPGAGIDVAGPAGELTPLTLVGTRVSFLPEPASLLLVALCGLFLRRR